MVAPAGAGPCPQITSTLSLPLRTSCRITGTSPPGPLRCGSTTCSVKAVATAASKALPPRSRIPMPTAVAIQWVEATTPKVPSISGRVVKGLGLMLPAIGTCARFWEAPPNHSLQAGPTRLAQNQAAPTSWVDVQERHYGLPTIFPESLRLRTRELHHLGPLLGLLGHVLPELGGRAGNERRSHAGEPLFHGRIGEDRIDGGIELVDDLGGRAFRRTEAIPRTRLVARHEIGDGWDVRQQARPRRSGDRQIGRASCRERV